MKTKIKFYMFITLLFFFLFGIVFLWSDNFRLYDIAGLLIVTYGVRNIIAYHLRLPLLIWTYGRYNSLKQDRKFIKQVYLSSYTIVVIGVVFILA